MKIGKWQRSMLSKMASSKRGVFYSLMNLHGKALSYKPKYEKSLQNVIKYHNTGRVKDSPIKAGYMIQTGKYGIRGGLGYRVVPALFV